MKLKSAIAAIAFVSALAAPVAAGTFEDAVDAKAITQRPCALFAHWPMMATLRPSSISA